MSERARAALISIAIAGLIAVVELSIATLAGWITLADGHTSEAEIGIGILLLVIGAPASGAAQQALSRVERGPEILLGQLVVVTGFVIAGDVFDGTYRRSAIGWGLLLIAAKMSLLCGVGARMTWTLGRSTERRAGR